MQRMYPAKLSDLFDPQSTIKGRWRTAGAGELEYRGFIDGEAVRLRFPIIAADAGGVLLAVTEKQSNDKTITFLARLSGVWRTTEQQRLALEVAGRRNRLTLKGVWGLSPGMDLVYSLETERLKTKQKTIQALRFEGRWRWAGRDLSYEIEADSASVLRFHGSLRKVIADAKGGRLIYQLKAGFEKRKRATALVFQGEWNYSETAGLEFEMERSSGKDRLAFGLNAVQGKTGRWQFLLKTGEGRRLGTEIVFSKEIMKGNASFFSRFEKDGSETRWEAGLKSRWG